MVSLGFRAWSSEPELYQKTSFISPVARRVLTMLSPSPPWGRVSSSIVMLGFSAVKASDSACASAIVSSVLSTR